MKHAATAILIAIGSAGCASPTRQASIADEIAVEVVNTDGKTTTAEVIEQIHGAYISLPVYGNAITLNEKTSDRLVLEADIWRIGASMAPRVGKEEKGIRSLWIWQARSSTEGVLVHSSMTPLGPRWSTMTAVERDGYQRISMDLMKLWREVPRPISN